FLFKFCTQCLKIKNLAVVDDRISPGGIIKRLVGTFGSIDDRQARVHERSFANRYEMLVILSAAVERNRACLQPFWSNCFVFKRVSAGDTTHVSKIRIKF